MEHSSLSRRTLLASLAAGALGPALLRDRAVAVSAAASAPSPVLPARTDIVAVMRRVNDHWLGANSNPGNNQWARSAYFSGNMAAYRTTADARYLRYAQTWAEQNNYGLHNGTITRSADDQIAGQVYYDLNDVAPDPAKVAAVNESIRLMVYGSQSAKVDDWWWVDALHMAMPVFVRVAKYRNDDAYLRKLYSLYSYTKKTIKLYDYSHELWYRDARFVPGGALSSSPNGKPVFWSRGNGWAIAAHAKTLGLLSPTETRWPEYRNNLAGVARTLRLTQRTDGFWNVNLGDSDHYPGPETSGTSYFVFGLAYGIRTGVIDRATYLPVVARAWNGLVATAVHSDGFLGYVQNVGDQPSSSQPVTTNTTADFAVGGFLLAGAELAGIAS
jgi:unsaturated rhamnogalacturonyl hydrolase